MKTISNSRAITGKEWLRGLSNEGFVPGDRAVSLVSRVLIGVPIGFRILAFCPNMNRMRVRRLIPLDGAVRWSGVQEIILLSGV